MSIHTGGRIAPVQVGAMLFALVQLLAFGASADVPALINYQATLSDSTGVPVPDGAYTISFAIFDAETGGSQVWQETHEVTTSAGWFSVYLGSVTALPDTLFTDARWLSVSVQAAAGAVAVHSPGQSQQAGARSLIASGPAAISAKIAQGVAKGAVGTSGLATGAVSSGKIQAGAVKGSHIDAGAVSASAIAGGAVQTPHIGAKAVTGDKIGLTGLEQGYVRIGELQICWGSLNVTTAASTNVDISFPAPFADTNYSMSVLSSGVWSFVTAYSSSKYAGAWNNLTMLDYAGHYQTGVVHWMAIGKW
jgi:hypothetical protein